MGHEAAIGVAKKPQQSKWAKFTKWIPYYLMMLPGLLYFLINNYIPMAGITVAFRKYNVKTGLFGGEWVGLSNFTYLFKNDAFTIIRNTLLYNVVFIIVNMVLGVAIAIIISDVTNKKARKLYQSAILVPFLVSIVIVSYIVYAFLGVENGLINKSLLNPMGKESISWYSEPQYWPFVLVLVNTWKSVGYGCLIYIASIAGIDKSLYEAAELDGANKWQQICRITLPSLIPSIITLLLLNIGRIFYSDFGLFYQVPQNSGQLFSVTNTIDTYVYRALISNGGIGRSSAAGVLQSFVGFTLVMVSNLITRKVSSENAIF